MKSKRILWKVCPHKNHNKLCTLMQMEYLFSIKMICNIIEEWYSFFFSSFAEIMWHKIYRFRCTTWWSHGHIYCKMITTIGLGNISMPSDNYHLSFMVTIFRIYSHDSFSVYDAVLLIIITMLNIRSAEHTPLTARSL